MLKPLKTLIKITKYSLDEKRKILNALLESKEQMIKKIKQLEDEINEEQKKNEIMPLDLRMIFPYFVIMMRNRQQVILSEIEKLNPQIQKATDELYEVFTENKKYEVLRDRKIEEFNYEFNKKQQLELDEIAIAKFARQEQ
ncbi:MAG TPA: hypothetical protein DIV86_06345 [Alphaproteobacteria bacterium]|nr:hypothetical protein [Alphaproteobacteria bacterium]